MRIEYITILKRENLNVYIQNSVEMLYKDLLQST